MRPNGLTLSGSEDNSPLQVEELLTDYLNVRRVVVESRHRDSDSDSVGDGVSDGMRVGDGEKGM